MQLRALFSDGKELQEQKNQMKTLIIAEKPSVATDIARVLGGDEKRW